MLSEEQWAVRPILVEQINILQKMLPNFLLPFLNLDRYPILYRTPCPNLLLYMCLCFYIFQLYVVVVLRIVPKADPPKYNLDVLKHLIL